MKSYITSIFLVISCFCAAQQTLDQLLDQYTDRSIPYISTERLASIQDSVILFDTREKEEYNVSHLKNAIHIGYNHFKIKSFIRKNISKDAHIVVYCSLGIRSENIGKRLKKAGYINTSNLYGGIFEWKNKGYPVFTTKEEITDNIHAYSEEWSAWLYQGKKVYSN
ncbi:rhodanese-like domain-containing protein [Aquimarina pacifica]|uniref:rhodanese-like domain-containing protein n=1 Tax=Aquimarina pacifica TaxID=1296415 RepID=UPI0004716801|nr:rhodanese-like domain-containing protein [Aquimarina pacifica]